MSKLMLSLLGPLVEGISEMDINEAEHAVCTTWHKSTFDWKALTKILTTSQSDSLDNSHSRLPEADY